MLLTLKDYNTTSSLHLSHLFYVLSMAMLYDYMYKIYLDTIVVCPDGTIIEVSMFAIGCYLCSNLFAGHILLLVCSIVHIMAQCNAPANSPVSVAQNKWPIMI